MTAMLATAADGQVDEVLAYSTLTDGTPVVWVRLPALDGCPALEVAISATELHIENAPAPVAAGDEGQEIHSHEEEGSTMHDTHPNAVDQARRALTARTEPTAPETMQVTTLSSGRAGQVWLDLNLYEEVDEAGHRVPDRWEVTVQYDGEITRMPVESLPAVAVAFTEYVAIVQAVAPPTVADLIVQARREDRPVGDVAANAHSLDVPAPHWHTGPMPAFETCDLLTDPPTSHRLFERVLAGAGADVIVEAEDRLQGGRLHRHDATISVDCGVDLDADQARSLAARLLAAAELIEDRPVRRDEDAIRAAAEVREGLA